MSGFGSGSAIHRAARRVSVVIPTLNAGPRFLEVLEALAAQNVEDGFELVVIDSGSTDGTAEAAAAAGAYVEKIERRDFGHGRTRNLGISRTGGEIVALLTQDALPLDASYLRSLVAPFEDPGIDGVYARQLPRPDCDPLLAERLRRWSASRGEREVRSLARGDPRGARSRFEAMEPMERYLTAAFDDVASSLRRATWERIPLPERAFGEDVAWAREVLLAGGAICFEPSARVEHSHRIELGREFRRIYRDHQNLRELFGLQNVATWGQVLAGWSHQRAFYRDLLAGQNLPPARRIAWRLYSIPYALLETSAQFLGARSREKARQSRFWAWADRRWRLESGA